MPKRRPSPAVVGVAVLRRELHALTKRVAKLEGQRKRIGFQTTSIEGERLEQDDIDEDFTPDEVP